VEQGPERAHERCDRVLTDTRARSWTDARLERQLAGSRVLVETPFRRLATEDVADLLADVERQVAQGLHAPKGRDEVGRDALEYNGKAGALVGHDGELPHRFVSSQGDTKNEVAGSQSFFPLTPGLRRYDAPGPLGGERSNQ
jgi:hypothetical protein